MTTNISPRRPQTALGKTSLWLLKAGVLLLLSALAAMVIVAIATGSLAHAPAIGCRIAMTGLIVAGLGLLAATLDHDTGAATEERPSQP